MTEETQVITEELRDSIRKEVEYTLRAENSKALAEEINRLQSENAKSFEKAVEEWREKQKPPSAEAISRLLNQEYAEFTVKLPFNGKDREFTIRELPQAKEKKFYRKFKERLIPEITSLAELTVKIAEGQVEQKLIAVLNSFEPMLDLLAEATLIALNPSGADEDITLAWVQDNISSFRQWNIVLAQERVNRLVDFLSLASVASLSGGLKGVGSQQ